MRGALWLVLGACAAPAELPDVDTAPEAVLDEQSYWFCHEPGADALEAEAWCPLLDGAPSDKCPGLRATCAEPPSDAQPPSESCNGRGDQPAEPGKVAGPASPEARPRSMPRAPRCGDLLAPSGLSRILTWVGAFLVAFLVLLILRAVISTFGAPKLPPREEALPLPESEDDALPDVPNLPSGDLLAAARAALADGRPGEAVLLARGAALRRLGEQERLRLHRSKTDREYVRAMRRDPDAQRELRDVVGAVEHHRWGGEPLGSERASRAIAAAERLLGVAVAVLAMVLAMYAAPAQAQMDGGRFGPNGDAALRTVLEEHGYDTQMRLQSLSTLDAEVDALVLDLSFVELRDEHWEHVARWVREGGVLVVAGNPLFTEEFDAPVFPELGRWVSLEAPEGAQLAGPLVDAGLPEPVWSGGVRSAFTGGEAWVSVGTDAAVAVAWVEAGVVVAIADARLLWNGSFVDPANEAFVGELLYHGQAAHGWPLPTPTRVQLATTSAVIAPGQGNGDGDNNPLASLQNAGLFPFVAQMLVTWALFGLWRGWPFAPLRDPPEEGRLEFAEHVQALGTRWYRLGASRYALVQTARLWLARLGTSGLQLAARRGGRTPAQAAAWVEGLQALVDDPQGPDDPSDLERMEELWKVTHPPT